MVKVAKGAKALRGQSKHRARLAELSAEHVTDFSRDAANAEYQSLLSLYGRSVT